MAFLPFLFLNAGDGAVAAAPHADNFSRRAELIIHQTADRYRPPSPDIGDPEKYYWPYVIARLHRYGASDAVANDWIARFAERPPFHFTLVGMARMLGAFPEAPALSAHKGAILSGVFARTDQYNAFTGEGTENHVAMSRTSGYLFAQAAEEDERWHDAAINAKKEMTQWIADWSKKIFYRGFGEWNSSTYQMYNLAGWLNLYDFAEDEQVKDRARAVLDCYALELAIQYAKGTIGGGEMRGSDHTRQSASAFLGWLWFEPDSTFRLPFQGNQYIQIVHAALSQYRPPRALVSWVSAINQQAVSLCGHQPDYLKERADFVSLTTYRDKNVFLGSASSAYGGYTGTTAQIIPWKLLILDDASNEAQEIKGNGNFFESAKLIGRDPYTQVVQCRNTLIQMTRVPVDAAGKQEVVAAEVAKWKGCWARDFKSRWPGQQAEDNHVNQRLSKTFANESVLRIPRRLYMDEPRERFNVRSNRVSVLIHTLSGRPPSVRYTEAFTYITDRANHGQVCGFVVEAFSSADGAQEHGEDQLITTDPLWDVVYRTRDGNTIAASYGSAGTFEEAISDWGCGMTVPTVVHRSPPLSQPEWPDGENWGKIPSFQVNGKSAACTHHSMIWHGAGITLGDGLLTVDGGYTVDYRGERPIFLNH